MVSFEHLRFASVLDSDGRVQWSVQMVVEPKLAKPGAGLPFVEWAVAKYILLPRLFETTDKEKALKAFAKESEKIMAISSMVAPNNLTERRLIPRLRGLEDSSRYWSVAMTLQHLIIVGDLMRQTVLKLSIGDRPTSIVGTADVKPPIEVVSATVLEDFKLMSERFLQETSTAKIDAFPQVTHPHPWFGPLNAQQWLAFAAPHENIHRKQIEAIIARF